MSSEKRLVLFFVLSFASIWVMQFALESLGVIKPPPPPKAKAPVVAAGDSSKVETPKDADLAKTEATPAVKEPAKSATKPGPSVPVKPEPPTVASDLLVLGPDSDAEPDGYRIQARFRQAGAVLRSVKSLRYFGETAEGVPDRKTRLQIIKENRSPTAPPSLSLTLIKPGDDFPNDADAPKSREVVLDSLTWEVIRDGENAPVVRDVAKEAPGRGKVPGRELAFRTTLDDPKVTVVKRYRLWKGEDGFEIDLGFEPTEKPETFSYRLVGPHGIPIEGEWYTSTYREVYFGVIKGSATDITTRTAGDVVGAKANPEKFQSLPIKFTGVENQYFAVFLQPSPFPTTQEARWDKETLAIVVQENPESKMKADVGVEIVSVPLAVRPNHKVTHTWKVFAGPKTGESLAPYDAGDLGSYRKQSIPIPFATVLAKQVISPLLDVIYDFTETVARAFGFKNGNYGIAIILLTMTVRLLLFPLGRKQAVIAKKMQDLQPYLTEIKEKYADDKEALNRETMALWRKHGVNPAAGCLPALIQLPIFVGLWQTLNNSVELRHSTFLYIKNLAAPDMLFPFGTDVPWLGPYFNLLPLFVVGLMLVQTKLFSPPAVTEEQKMNQKVMTYMMVFMAFMFYKVPSGLGIYFITSSLWQICERLLLPKITGKSATTAGTESPTLRLAETEQPASASRSGALSKSTQNATDGSGGWLSRKLEKLLEEAQKQQTIRNEATQAADRKRDGAGDRDRDRDRDRRNRPNQPRRGRR